jgi:RNA polymerase sigma factor (sigma-70 family)
VRVQQPGLLVRAAAAGDEGAWRELVEGFAGVVWAVTRTFGLDYMDAADVSQTTWLRLAEHLDRIQDPDRVGGWLVTTARREAMRVRARSARVVPVDDHADKPDERLDDLDAALIRDERGVALWTALQQTPEPCRSLLRVLLGDPAPSYEEVSLALDMPIGSIGPKRARCLAALRRRVASLPTIAEERA